MANATAATAVPLCSRGEFYAPDSSTCEPCPEETFHPDDNHRIVSCQDWGECVGPLQYEAVAPTPTSDRTCFAVTTCGQSQFEVSAPNNTAQRQCAALRTCGAGHHVAVPATATRDRVCARCPDGAHGLIGQTFQNATNQPVCAEMSFCGLGEYAQAPGSVYADVVCEACAFGYRQDLRRHRHREQDVCLARVAFGAKMLHAAVREYTHSKLRAARLRARAKYGEINTWDVSIVEDMASLFFGNKYFNDDIDSWQTGSVLNMNGMFEATTFNQPLDSWQTGSATDLRKTFGDARRFNQPLDSWQTSSATNMREMFFRAKAFNQPLDSWQTESAEDVRGMFADAIAFNGPLNSWQMGSIYSTNRMFQRAKSFNQNIDSWQMDSATDIINMFEDTAECVWSDGGDDYDYNYDDTRAQECATGFNQPLDSWQVGSVTRFDRAFKGAAKFNQAINSWQTGAAKDMESMFSGTNVFDQPLNAWQTGSVTNLVSMFDKASVFNRNINSWRTDSVASFDDMFHSALEFNQPLNSWQMKNAKFLINMFASAKQFNQNIASWQVGSAKSMDDMFHRADAFAQDLSAWSSRFPPQRRTHRLGEFCSGENIAHIRIREDPRAELDVANKVCRADVAFKLGRLGGAREVIHGQVLDDLAGSRRLLVNRSNVSAFDYVVGERYVVAPPRIDVNATVMNTGWLQQLTYRLFLSSRTATDAAGADGMDAHVDCSTGAVFVRFDKPGVFRLPLVARDAEKVPNELVLEEYTFNVQPRQVFKIATRSGWNTSTSLAAEDGYFDKFIRGTTPNFGAINATKFPADKLYEGLDGVSKIVYFMSFNKADTGAKINTSDAPLDVLFGERARALGEVRGRVGQYTGRLYVQQGGEQVLLKRWDFEVVHPPKFKLNPDSDWDKSTSLTDGYAAKFIKGTTQRFGAMNTSNFPADKLFKGFDGVSKIVYFMTFDKTDTAAELNYSATPLSVLFGDDATALGEVQGPVGNYTGYLWAQQGGEQALLKQWDFVVEDPPAVDRVLVVAPGWRYNTAYDDRVYQNTNIGNATTTLTLAVGEPHNFPPVNLSTFKVSTPGMVGAANTTFTLVGAPPGFLIDSSSGFVQGSAAGASGPHLMHLVALDGGGRRSEPLAIYNITLKAIDTSDDANGPNGSGCDNGAKKGDNETSLFDGHFVCQCVGGFSGDNCEVGPPSSSSSDAESHTTTAIVAGVLIAVIASLLAVLLVRQSRARAERMKPFDFAEQLEKMLNTGLILPSDDVAAADASSRVPKELNRKQVTLTKVIGSGAFGEVWKGVFDDSAKGGVSDYLVGVKTLIKQTEESTEEMLQESLVMAHIGSHKNVISIVGVVSVGMPKLLVMSFCENGSLLSYLKTRVKDQKPLTGSERLKAGLDVARGMEHLVTRRVVHRDLATRNVLVDSLLTCKVADFGLSVIMRLASPGCFARYSMYACAPCASTFTAGSVLHTRP